MRLTDLSPHPYLVGYDADQNYDLKPLGELLPGSELSANPVDGSAASSEYVYREPVQKPTTPAYRAYLEAQGGAATTLDSNFAAGPQSRATA